MSAVADKGQDRLSSEALARRIAELADAKQAEDVVALDMRSLVGYTDFLVICTARNERLAKAIHEEVHQRLKQDDGLLPATVEGERSAQLGADGLPGLRVPRVRPGAAGAVPVGCALGRGAAA